MKKPLLFVSFLVFAASGAQAAASDWKTNAEGKVRLVLPYVVAPQRGEITFGIHFLPEPGWMVYWKQPGDAGFPPKFNFKGSRGFKDPEVLWPRPKYFLLPGEIKEYGYDEEMIYPVKAQAVAGKILHIAADVNYLTCKESCVPHRYTLSLDVPQAAMAQPDPAIASAVQHFVSQVPPAGENVLNSLRPEVLGSGDIQNQWWILLLAFLGGLILNVMPCVLPVLAIKLFGLIQHGGQDRSIVIRDTLASAAGIVVSFLIGGGILVAAKEAGHAVGWGIQFQSPLFVVLLMVIVFVFAFNMWGLFEIPLPASIARIGAFHVDDTGPLSFFVSGIFAALLATPCSAPFLGTAMGFALTQPPATIVWVFAAVGVGMAVPYLALAVFPGTLQWLPRPGLWMIRLKMFLGVLLAGTGIWLAWVFVHQVGLARTLSSQESGPIQWVSFDESKIQPWVAAGTPVFVVVTADWCVTCKVNERFVLQDADVVAEFKKRGVVMMRADWTHQDAAIGDYLKRYGRVGIPFYALYYPYKGPVLLSELLTKKQVLRELKAWDAL